MSKERPILFSAPMVRAIFDGSKTQTRRIVKPAPGEYWNPVVESYNPIVIDNGGYDAPGPEIFGASDETEGRKFPYGQPGDRLWVRETWYCDDYRVQSGPYLEVDGARELLTYRADDARPYEADQPIWKPSIHMPRWASRILLEIVSVRVERLNDIGVEDIQAEGVKTTDAAIIEHGCRARVMDFARLWESINGAGSWDTNPWCWAIEFRRVLT